MYRSNGQRSSGARERHQAWRSRHVERLAFSQCVASRAIGASTASTRWPPMRTTSAQGRVPQDLGIDAEPTSLADTMRYSGSSSQKAMQAGRDQPLASELLTARQCRDLTGAASRRGYDDCAASADADFFHEEPFGTQHRGNL
jgi:hypothetical protein